MTFTHKLARRLALLRAATVSLLMPVIFLAGCSAGEPTSANHNPNIGTDEGGPVVLNPRSVVLEGRQSVMFRAFTSPLPGSDEVTAIEWTATGGSVSATGTFVADQEGEFKVVGKRRRGNPHDRPDTSVVIVVPPQPTLEALLITPSSATVGVGLQQRFTAVGRQTDGELVSVGVTWTATGGDIDAGGVYTAGTASGSYQVTATHATTGLTATATVTIPTATLTSLKLSPGNVSIPVGTSVQFSTIGTLSDGSTSNVPVTYAATGGTISYSGLYKAGSASGTFRVIATAAGSTKADTTPVSVTPPPAPAPVPTGGLWRDETFSTYTSDEHWRSNPWGWQSTAPDWYNQGAIHIDRSVTYNGHPTLRYDWPAPPYGDASNWCGKDITRAAGYKLPQVKEVWLEVAHRFATTFNTNVINHGGYCPVGEYKHVLIWRSGAGASNRWSVSNGTYGSMRWSAHPSHNTQPTPNCSGIGWKCRLGYGGSGTNDQSQYLGNVPSSMHWDGQWHIYRFHIRLPQARGDNTGLYEIWIDGRLVKRVTGEDFISTDDVWTDYLSHVALGTNANAGTSQQTNTWWGHLRIWTSNPNW